MFNVTRKTPSRAALSLLAALAPLAALADEWDTLNFIVGHTITYDDNLFRLPSGTNPALSGSQRSDVINTTFVGLKLNKLVSRQRFIVDGILSRSYFSEYGQLDYDGRNINGRWLWELGNRWKGELSLQDTRRLSSFADLNVEDRNIVDYRRYYGSARYEFHPEWSVVGGLSRVDNTNSAAVQKASDFTANAVEAGAQFNPATGNQVALKYRRTKGEYPNRQLVSSSIIDNSYTQDDVELSALWRPTADSKFDGRVGLTERNHDQLSQRDFRGPTGRLSYDWNVTGKTLLNATLWREIWSSDDVNASYVLSNGLSFGPTYNATSKIQLQGKLQYVKRDFGGDPGFVLTSAPQPEDKIKIGSVTATYLPLRSLQLSLTLQTERRDSNIKSREYDDNQAILSGQFTF